MVRHSPWPFLWHWVSKYVMHKLRSKNMCNRIRCAYVDMELRQNSGMDRPAVIQTYGSVWITWVLVWIGGMDRPVGSGYGSGLYILTRSHIYIYIYTYISKYLEKTLFVSIWSISICNLLHFGAKISHLRANYLEHFGTRIPNLDGVCNILNLGSLVGRKCAASWNQFLHNDNIWSISKTLGSRKGHPQIWEGHTFVQ